MAEYCFYRVQQYSSLARLLARRRRFFARHCLLSGLLAVCAAFIGCSTLVETVTTSAFASQTPQGASLTPGTIPFPAGFMNSIKSYGAVGDGVTDDTEAIQTALNDGRSNPDTDYYYGRPKALYFPPGTYLVKKPLYWIGCCVTLQGDGPTASVIRLAPNSPEFGDPSNPKPLIQTPDGNESFHQNIWDLGITVGAGNPGAKALDYISNNSGALSDVLIKSEDMQGYSGIDMTRHYPGPLMLKNVEVDGFGVGIDLHNSEYSVTMEGITLKGQSVAGIRTAAEPLNIRSLMSENSVPALTNNKGFIVLLDATLVGGDPANPALQTNSTFYARNVVSSGYGETLLDLSGSVPNPVTGPLSEYLVGTPLGLASPASDMSLKLPIEETPTYSDGNLRKWAAFTPSSYGDTSTLQATLNSGASTVYFPFGKNATPGYLDGAYFSYNEVSVDVPDSVNRIVGFSSIINGSSDGANGGGIRFVVSGDSKTPLVIEEFGYGLKVSHYGSRPVVIKHTGGSYTSYPGAGPLYIEDVELGTLTLQPGQYAWARQLNVENQATKVTNPGGTLWILGIKTERSGTIIDTSAGGSTELLGGLIYPAYPVPTGEAAFQSTDSNVSYMYTESVYFAGGGYGIQVEETRDGVTKEITSSPNAAYRMPLFVAYQ